jgi:alpha-galactosidase
MCILNRNTTPQKVTFNWRNEKVTDSFSNRDAGFDKTVYSLRELWRKQDLGTTKDPLTTGMPGRDVLMLRLEKK